ncbi:hypothetical protein GCM10009527_059020 [Actinomadura nitritigenes]|uniref:DUF7668 domain-containing protein n=1 Tax=Actinomadura nitritigenes TaxID=134602 RepID=A0ABS3R8S3_9ACTN|nr:hypothetical protein [Actinomadura nitritigenes]MBO2442605.1 hypothetical protein [Actinomadura nitritigenes]
MLPEEGVNAVRVVVGLLVRGEYEELETLTEARRLTAAEIAAAVARHGRDLISPPDAAFREVDAVAVPHEPADEHAFHVEFPLWTAQDGLSDLTLGLTVTEVMDGVWTVELDGVHTA